MQYSAQAVLSMVAVLALTALFELTDSARAASLNSSFEIEGDGSGEARSGDDWAEASGRCAQVKEEADDSGLGKSRAAYRANKDRVTAIL